MNSDFNIKHIVITVLITAIITAPITTIAHHAGYSIFPTNNSNEFTFFVNNEEVIVTEGAIQELYEENEELRSEVLELRSMVGTLEEQNSLDTEQNRGQVIEYQNQISTLETEIENLQAEIDIFISRGESPIPRNPDGSLASIVSLRNMTNIGTDLAHATVTRDNYSNAYSEVLRFEGWTNQDRREYVFHTLLDSQYTRFQGVVFVGYGESRNRTVDIRFELDGRIIEPHTLDKTTRPISIDIDLTDVNDFRIIVTRNSSWATGFIEIYFADFNFYP